MRNLSGIGRIFYGISIAEIGLQTIYYHDFPYMMLPPNHSAVPGIVVLAYIFGALFTLTGACIVFEKKTRLAALLLGGVLLLIFCFYYIPYQFMAASRFMHFAEWENSAKELALAGGAFVVAGLFPGKDGNPITGFLGKRIHYGVILFAITILSFGIDHFVYGKDAAGYVPAWIPYRVFWIYFAGAALLASAIGIILNIKRALAATLLGAMVFTWFIILHIPYVINATCADRAGEITSAIIALAYCGIAFMIAGIAFRRAST
jgi:uncharacterized membrane protein